MISKKLALNIAGGLHARPVSQIIGFLDSFTSEVTIFYNGKSANAKSMISLLSLGVKPNEEMEIRMEGSNEQEEMDKFVAFLENLEH